MNEHGFDRFFVYRPENFAWLTGGGDNTVEIGEGVGYLEVSAREVLLRTSQVEVSRLQEEERAAFAARTFPWYSTPPIQRPNDLEADLTALRLVLSPEEQERFRALGRDAARALGEAMREARPEWTERKLAGEIASSMHRQGIQPVVLLVGGEERVLEYRHPVPKDRPLNRIAMGIICGRREGLVANLTRMRAWGEVPTGELYEKVLNVEAKALASSKPGNTLGEVLNAIKSGYREAGQPEAFAGHHQGGIAGYRSREVLATPDDSTVLREGMAIAWNPSLPGVKVEDTFLLTDGSLENLTHDPDWPMVLVKGRPRPGILTA